ncbi:hypothetical protein WBP07_20815 (plasmid) [Novosphingobium sp. BL-8A]
MAGLPFVFITGCNQEAPPDELAGIVRLQKPVEIGQIVSELAASIQE